MKENVWNACQNLMISHKELARKAFEKEQERYAKYMEKKRIKELKKEREILEKQLQHHSEEAGLVARALPPGVYNHLMICIYSLEVGVVDWSLPSGNNSVEVHGNSL